MGDLERVFEVGPVFRSENSFTHRHMTEFVGLGGDDLHGALLRACFSAAQFWRNSGALLRNYSEHLLLSRRSTCSTARSMPSSTASTSSTSPSSRRCACSTPSRTCGTAARASASARPPRRWRRSARRGRRRRRARLDGMTDEREEEAGGADRVRGEPRRHRGHRHRGRARSARSSPRGTARTSTSSTSSRRTCGRSTRCSTCVDPNLSNSTPLGRVGPSGRPTPPPRRLLLTPSSLLVQVRHLHPRRGRSRRAPSGSHDPQMLLARAAAMEPPVDLTPIQAYVGSFKMAPSPTPAAASVGERVVMLFLGLPQHPQVVDVPARDPRRLTPRGRGSSEDIYVRRCGDRQRGRRTLPRAACGKRPTRKRAAKSPRPGLVPRCDDLLRCTLSVLFFLAPPAPRAAWISLAAHPARPRRGGRARRSSRVRAGVRRDRAVPRPPDAGGVARRRRRQRCGSPSCCGRRAARRCCCSASSRRASRRRSSTTTPTSATR